jgi:hypothetical protein
VTAKSKSSLAYQGSTGTFCPYPFTFYIAAYRRWLGIDPYPKVSPRKRPKAKEEDLVTGRKVDLAALAVKGNAVSCRIPGTDRVLTFRPAGFFEGVPGEIITVIPNKIWRYAGHPYVSGEITAWRTDITGLGLAPLTLEEQGMWDPKEQYWGEPIEPWARPIIKKGIRSVYRMELVLPGWDFDDPDTDPIIEAVELKEADDYKKAHRALMNLLAADLRCLDAHAHLGNLVFDHDPDRAVRHYDMGVKIGELSLGRDFGGLLPWGFYREPPLPPVPARLRPLHVALRAPPGSREGIYPYALAQSRRQPGCARRTLGRERGRGLG